MTLEFSRQIFEKYSNSKFHKIRPVGPELLHADRRSEGQMDRQTDRHDEANSRSSQFRERE